MPAARSKPDFLPGINIQWPWSELLLLGDKTVETRSYPLPMHYTGKPLVLIETPGPWSMAKREDIAKRLNIAPGPRVARSVGLIVFQTAFAYTSKAQWLHDHQRHRVPSNDPFYAWRKTKPRWGWPVAKVTRFAKPLAAPACRGIIFAKSCPLRMKDAAAMTID